MDTKALRQEIQQQLASAEDGELLGRLKHRLDILLGQDGIGAGGDEVQEPEPYQHHHHRCCGQHRGEDHAAERVVDLLPERHGAGELSRMGSQDAVQPSRWVGALEKTDSRPDWSGIAIP